MNIGTDIIEISRIKKSIENPVFLNKVYTKYEQDYIFKKGNPAQTAAGIFAAKEAASKALGTGIGKVSFSDLCVLHNKNGMPYMEYKGERLHLSISHCNEYAVAFVIRES